MSALGWIGLVLAVYAVAEIVSLRKEVKELRAMIENTWSRLSRLDKD